MEWPEEAFRKSLMLRYRATEESQLETSLLQDVGIDVDFAATPPGEAPDAARLLVRRGEMQLAVRFSPGQSPMFVLESEPPAILEVDAGGDSVALLDYLNSHPVSIWLSDCSRLEGQNYYRRQADRRPIDAGAFTSVDWAALGVSINAEYADGRNPQADDGTIHGYILGILRRENADVVVYDHGAHESADVIGIWNEEDCVRVRLYHCKATRAQSAGCRLEDIYEVAGQAAKCVRWVHKPSELIEHLDRRSNGNQFRFPVGRLRDVQSLLVSNPKRVQYEVAIVQPGLSIAGLSDGAAHVLAAVNEYLWRDLGGRHLQVIASA